ncbi:MAG: hypothetical protein INF52_00375 [Rhodobacter sp.]|nr:hypothetical protein [Rhodobacter sp.]
MSGSIKALSFARAAGLPANMIKFALGFNGRCAAAGAVRRLEGRVILPAGRTFPAPDPALQEKGKKSKARFTLR